MTVTIPLPLSLKIRLMLIRAAGGFVGEKVGALTENERIFRDILHNYNNLVAGICLSFTSDSDDFKDLCQDTMLNIWRGIENFRHDSQLSTWIYRVTLNTCLTYQRKTRHRKNTEEASLEFYREIFSDSSREDIIRYKMMYSLIGKLKTIDKSMILLWLDEKSYEEIASVIGISRNAVASRLRRIKDRLSQMATEIDF